MSNHDAEIVLTDDERESLRAVFSDYMQRQGTGRQIAVLESRVERIIEQRLSSVKAGES